MAGLTKAQRAAREASSRQEVAQDERLVRMTKDGQTLDVHPSCVADHKRAGWRLAD